jgi:4-hydroxy-tetrahydrodipicolinate reductase
MNIVLLGYGRMGKDIEQVATERGHRIAARFDIDNPLPDNRALSTHLAGVDCCIDFSTAAATMHHIRTIAPLHIPLVVGTTGWNAQLSSLSEFVVQQGGTLLYASNFSIGAHIFFRAVTAATELIDRFPEYDIAIHEIHHRLKKDAPSGTALTLAKKILETVKRKKTIITSLGDHEIHPDELLVSSSRVGNVAGTHSALFDSPADSIQLTHTAHNRRGFAVGAVCAAEWIQGRTGVFTMEDFLFTK